MNAEQLLKSGQWEKALRIAQQAARARPQDPSALDLLARSFEANAKTRQALATYDRIARLAPQNPKPLADKALLLQQHGMFDDADETLRRAMRRAPGDGVLLRLLAGSGTLAPEDPIVVSFLGNWDQLGNHDRLHAGFALARVFEKAGDTKRVVSLLTEANGLQRQAAPFDIRAREREVQSLMMAFDKGTWPKIATSIGKDRRPIFVTGLPRSGTTLVEQILARHPQITGIGESGLPLRAAYSVLLHNGVFQSPCDVGERGLRLIGERLLQGIDHFHRPGAGFADKSIQTHLIIGLIKHVLPTAKIVFVKREPMAVGWSIWQNYFETGTHGYSNDLGDIGRYIRSAEAMVDFWRRGWPGSFIELAYEDLVSDPDTQIRALVDACDLPWDDACLTPEQGEGAIKTLSISQVRSPIGKGAKDRWLAYKDALGPLKLALEAKDGPWD